MNWFETHSETLWNIAILLTIIFLIAFAVETGYTVFPNFSAQCKAGKSDRLYHIEKHNNEFTCS